jgi:hypothetical protein
MAGQSTTGDPALNSGSPSLSNWHRAEYYTVFQPAGEIEDTFYDAGYGSDRQDFSCG